MHKTSPKKIKTMFNDFELTTKRAREKLVFSQKKIKEDLNVHIINSDRTTNVDINKEVKEKKNGKLE